MPDQNPTEVIQTSSHYIYAKKNLLLKLVKTTQSSFSTREHEQAFREIFNKTYPKFTFNIRSHHPMITRGEELTAMLISINLSTIEIASILGISIQGVKKSRYRLRKKLMIDVHENLKSNVLRFLQ